jgi:hypothetical protein
MEMSVDDKVDLSASEYVGEIENKFGKIEGR